ncbi:transcriptional regulator [Solihabitans fulvus]|uniref:Transcriptional regulator n=1 Tax=Solihabitans fulvus TaxID=1892852 RepID=A0A5B2WJW7_9PSEU|nr:helix-turn-helix transcriptional regulator [Solihabitans fulvus]KAA2251208.1 transcriptional regulator [Solihabitans fulvus]
MPAQRTRWKQDLGAQLEKLRKAAGKSAAEVATMLGTTESTVSRTESGYLRPQRTALDRALAFYKATEEQCTEAVALWEAAGEKTERVRLPADAPKTYRTLVRAEREAEVVRAIESLVIPGLLQTARYARALTVAAHRFLDPNTAHDAYVNARLKRQQRLDGPHPLRLHALIDEGVIYRTVGGPDVMREQLGHLLAVGGRPNVTIQAIPNDAGAYGPMSGPCTIIGYAGSERLPAVYLEYLTGGAWVDNAGDIERITAMFDDVVGLALSPADTADVIHLRMRALENQ